MIAPVTVGTSPDMTVLTVAESPDIRVFRVGSLFSGIGGLDLGLERAGMEVIWQSEIDPYASRVLAKHWPNVPNLRDVTKIEWSEVERPDLICGGYPCQPFSLAGARRGANDERHLWPYFADALRILRPEWALLENVPGHLSLGFGDVQSDLAELGYDTEWECLPASALGAPHLRFRIVCVAHYVDANGESESGQSVNAVSVVSDAGRDGLRQQSEPIARSSGARVAVFDGPPRDMADADEIGREGWTRELGPSGWREPSDGGWWTTEPDVGRVANGIPSRMDRLRGLGNAVVPQVAEWVGRRIMEAVT